MNIAVNTRLLIKDKLEGIGRYSFETLKRLVALRPNDTFYFLFDRQFDESFVFGSNVYPVVIGPQARHPFLYYYWYNFSVKRFLKEKKTDLFISMDGMLPLKTYCKQIAVIHDLNFEHYPKFLPFLLRRYYRRYFPIYAKTASRILTVSEFSKKDIVATYNVSKTKIDVSCNAASSVFSVRYEEENKSVKDRCCQGQEYFLYVGSINPRKNLEGALLAFDLFKSKTNSKFKFLVVGDFMWSNGKVKKLLSKLKFKDDVIFTGRLNDAELSGVMSACYALVYVSFFEGFGIPILEAMKSGVPVIAANNSSMIEVGGDAAILVGPENIQQIADSMEMLINDQQLRQDLISKGFKQEQNYTWDLAAAKMNESIDKCLA